MRDAFSSQFPFCGSLDGAAGVRRHLIEVQLDGVFDDSPFGALLMPRKGMEFCQCCRPNCEQPAGIVPDTLRFTLLPKAFRWPATALCGLFHIGNYDITKYLICDITNAILYS